MPTWTDKLDAWASLASALIALGGIFFLVRQVRHAAFALVAQSTSSDIASVLVIWQRLDEHWIRYRAAGEESKDFEFGQLISYYEMACSLFRDKVFTTRATRTLHEHLHEILPAMQQDLAFRVLFNRLKTDDSTFENIRWFCNQPAPRSRKLRG